MVNRFTEAWIIFDQQSSHGTNTTNQTKQHCIVHYKFGCPALSLYGQTITSIIFRKMSAEDEYFYPPTNYPSLVTETLGIDMIRLKVVDSFTGEVLAFMDEPLSRSDDDNESIESSSPQFDTLSVYACNLDLRTSKQEIFCHFSSLGQITRITFLKNKTTNRFTGSVYIQFKETQSAEEALFLDGSYLRGQLINVKEWSFKINSFSSVLKLRNVFLILETRIVNLKFPFEEKVEDSTC